MVSGGADGSSDRPGPSDDAVGASDADTANSTADAGSPRDTMRGRIEANRWKTWLLLDADRWLVAAVLSSIVFASIVLASVLDVAPMRAVIREQTALWWVFSPLIGAIVTGVTLVVTFTQLVLSQELGPLGDQRDRMEGAVEFRTDVASRLDVPTAPPEPASFLEALVGGVRAHAADLQAAADECDDEQTRQQVIEFADSLTEHSRAVSSGLEGAEFGEFDVLYSVLNFNYSWKIYEARRLRAEYSDTLDEETNDEIDDVVEMLEFFGPAREHFKTLYFQWELINLSRLLLYAAVPALVVTVLVQLYVSPASFTGVYFGVDGIVWVVASATTIAFVPFFLLTAYVLRIATIAKRTLAIGPFILRDTDRSQGVDWK